MESKKFYDQKLDSIQNSQDKSIRKKVCENNYSHLRWNTKFNLRFDSSALEMIKQGNLEQFIEIYFSLPQFKKENYKLYYMYFEQFKDLPVLISLEKNRSLELFKEFIEKQLEQRDQVKKFTDFIQQIQDENSNLLKNLNKTKQDNIQKQNIFKENCELQRNLNQLYSKHKKLLKKFQTLQWNQKQDSQNDQVKLEIFENQCIKNKLDDYLQIQKQIKEEISELKENQGQLKMKIDVNEDNKKNWIKEAQNITKKIKMEKQKMKLLQGQTTKLNQQIKVQQQISDYKSQNEQIDLKIQKFEKNIKEFQDELQSIERTLLKKRQSQISIKKKIEKIQEKLKDKEENFFESIRPETNQSDQKQFPLRSTSHQRKIKTSKAQNFYPNSKQLRSFRRSNIQTSILKSEISQNFIFSMNNLEKEIGPNRQQKLQSIKKSLEKYTDKNEQHFIDMQNKLKFLKWKIKSSFFLINQKIQETNVQKSIDNGSQYTQNLLKNLDDTFNSKLDAFSFKNKSLLNEKNKDEFSIFINQLGTLLNIEIQNTQNFFSECLIKIENIIVKQQGKNQLQKKYNTLKKLVLQLIQQNQIKNVNKPELISLLSDSTVKKYDKN